LSVFCLTANNLIPDSSNGNKTAREAHDSP
jgi:hypothetical protein